jgi:DNA polymerase-3 subunit delta'
MKFSDIIGNASVAKMLSSMADSGRVAHAMLLYENEGCGALALALAYV